MATPPAAAAPSTVQMYDAATGAPVQVEASQAGDLLRSGRAGFAADQQVAVMGLDGKISQMSGADAAAYLGSAAGMAGAGAATEGQVQRQQLEEQYGGAGGMALAAGAGALRGATLGLSDLALTETGLVNAKTLKGLEEVNPLTSLVGEGAGMLAPVLLSGGAGGAAGAARGAGGLARAAEVAGTAARITPAAGVSALGRAVEGGLLGADAAAAGWGLRAGAAAAGAATEGALYGVGQAVSRASLDDVKLTGEKLVAAAGMGALIGGGLGGGLSAAGSLLRGGAEAGAGALSRRLAQGEQQLAGELTAAAPKTAEGAAAMAGRLERDLTLKGLGADARAVGELRGLGAEAEARVVRIAHEDLAKAAGKESGALLSPAERASGARALADAAEAKVTGLAEELGKAGGKAQLGPLLAQQREAMAKLGAESISPSTAKALKETEKLLGRMEKVVAEGDPAKLLSVQRQLRVELEGAEGVAADLQRSIVKGVDQELERVGQSVEAKLGPEWAARWKNATAEAQATSWMADTTAKAAKHAPGSFGPLDAGKAALGALTGGGGLTGAALAVPSAYAQRMVALYGAEAGAQLARAAARGELVSQLGRHVDQLLGERAAQLVGVGRGALSAVRPVAPLSALASTSRPKEDPKAEFKARSRELAAFRASPGPRLEAATAGLAGARPEVRQAVAATVQRGVDFLASKMPRRPPAPAGLPAHLQREQTVSPSEASTWLRYARAVDNPLGVLEDARRGVLSREAIEAVKTVYPDIYGALRSQVQEALLERQKPLAWKERVQLSLLLGLPTDPNLEPDAIRLYQSVQTVAPSPTPNRAPGQGKGQAPPAPPAAPRRPMSPPDLATKGDRLAA